MRQDEPFTWSLRRDLVILVVSAALGSAAANLNIDVPNTPAYVEVRWLFGFLGFVLIRRLPVALVLPVVLSVASPAGLPWYVVLGGNMLYALPFCFTLRVFYRRVLVNFENMAAFGAAWCILVMAGYQVFTTPLFQVALGLIQGSLSLSYVLQGWSDQLWFEESIAVAVVSTLGMIIARMYFLLRYREEHLRTILHSIGDGVIVTDTAERVQMMNPVAEKLTGWAAGEARGKLLPEVFDIRNAETGKRADNPVRRVIENGAVVGLANHTRLIAKNGSSRQIADSGAPITGDDGVIRGAVLVFRDVTEEYALREQIKKDLDEKNILLKEVHHRVKNNLQIISSLLHLQADVSKDELIKAVLEDLRMRIVSMSLIHNQLYRTGVFSEIDMEEYVKTLSDEVLHAYGRAEGVKVTVSIRDQKLDLQTVIPCGLILNELISNSLKHAFDGRKDGAIFIGLDRGKDEGWLLTYADNGKGLGRPEEARKSESLGLLLVRGLIQQLEGKAEVFTEGGTRYVISFPAAGVS